MCKPPPFVWHLIGKKAGPTATILAGVHGNELPGLVVLRVLLRALGFADRSPGRYQAENLAGNLYLGFGNPEAILKNSRASAPSEDLNRCFLPEFLRRWPRKTDSNELRRARELVPLLEQTDYLLDLHATHLPSPPLVGCEQPTPRHLELAHLLPVEHVLTNGKGVMSETDIGTTDNFVDCFGGERFEWLPIGPPSIMMGSWTITPKRTPAVGLYYEVGLKTDFNPQSVALTGALRWLATIGILPTTATLEPLQNQTLWAISDIVRHKQDAPKFIFAPDKKRGFTSVAQGELIGHYEPGAIELLAPSTGALVLQNDTQPLLGAPACFIASPLT